LLGNSCDLAELLLGIEVLAQDVILLLLGGAWLKMVSLFAGLLVVKHLEPELMQIFKDVLMLYLAWCRDPVRLAVLSHRGVWCRHRGLRVDHRQFLGSILVPHRAQDLG
jgi:hypothetical protein